MSNYEGIEDNYLPLIAKPILQRYDNYQIYSLTWFQIKVRSQNRNTPRRVRSEYGESLNIYYQGNQEVLIYLGGTLMNFTRESDYIDVNFSFTPYVTYQRYSPNKIPFSFNEVINKVKILPRASSQWSTLDSTVVIDSVIDEHIVNGNSTPFPPVTDRSSYQAAANLANSLSNPNYNPNKFTYVLTQEAYYSQIDYGANPAINRRRRVLYYQLVEDTYSKYGTIVDPINMSSLINGYSLDIRTKPPNRPRITPTKSGKLSIVYYRKNTLEPIPTITSLDWMSYDLDVLENQSVVLPLIDPIFGTLYFSGDNAVIADIQTQLSALSLPPNNYKWENYYYSNIDSVIGEWIGIMNSIAIPSKPAIGGNIMGYIFIDYSDMKTQVVTANNNIWLNDFDSTDDIVGGGLTNPNNHPNGIVAYNWHIKPQTDGSYGNLIMDSPRTIEIHAALNAGKWGINPDNPQQPRKDDLGWRIQRMNEVLGIRVGTDGKFDPEKEKKIVRRVIPATQKLDAEKVGVNNFSESGMVVKRINNRFNGDKIESDQCVIVHDLLQLIQEYHEQHNLAVGLQESSAIEIKDGKDKEGKSKARFDNQLGLLVEIFNLLSSANEMTRAALISSLVTQSQTSEVIAGLGLPSVTKTIPIEIDKKVSQLPYKGIAPHRSISQEVATCTANVGIVLGQLI